MERRSLDVFVDTVGFLEAEGQTEVAAGVSGVVDEVYFREGHWVDRDNILLKIDQRRYEALWSQAEANYKKAEANVIKAQAGVKKADAALDYAQKTKGLDDARYEFALKSGGGVSREELAEREAAVRQAAARVEEARSGVEVARAEVGAAQKEVDAAHALRELADRSRNLSVVRAPYAGQINQRRVTTAGTYVEDKTVIATMADLRRLRLVGWIPEKAAPVVREMMVADQRLRAARILGGLFGDPTALTGINLMALEMRGELRLPTRSALEFRLLPYPDRVFKGRVFYLSTVASPETHMFECKAEVASEEADIEMKPGYMARIRAPLRGNALAVIVPEEAVRASERGFVAYVPEVRKTKDGKEEWVARARPVDLGYRSGIGRQESKSDKTEMKAGMVEVLNGLRPQEWIVIRGAEALEDGTPIAIPKEQQDSMNR